MSPVPPFVYTLTVCSHELLGVSASDHFVLFIELFRLLHRLHYCCSLQPLELSSVFNTAAALHRNNMYDNILVAFCIVPFMVNCMSEIGGI